MRSILVQMLLRHRRPLTSSLCHPWAEAALRNIEQLCRNRRNSLNWMLHSQAAEQMISCSLTIQITAIKVERWGPLRPSWRQSGKMSLQDSGLWGDLTRQGVKVLCLLTCRTTMLNCSRRKEVLQESSSQHTFSPPPRRLCDSQHLSVGGKTSRGKVKFVNGF